MIKNSRLLFLGTGGSLGIPVLTCQCLVCKSHSPLNKRLRPSALLDVGEKRYLIDCGPDFKRQALTHDITRLDGLFLTHSHYDHCSGIDELRVFTFKRGTRLACIMSNETHQDLLKMFYYVFSNADLETKYTTNFSPIFLPNDTGTLNLEDNITLKYCSYRQGGMKVNGFRIGELAFLTDIKEYDDSIFEFIAGVKFLVISALRFATSPLHLSIDEAVAFAQKACAKETWLTHIGHEVEHETANAYLPPNIRLAYDGLSIHFNTDKA